MQRCLYSYCTRQTVEVKIVRAIAESSEKILNPRLNKSGEKRHISILERRKEMLHLMMPSTHFYYGYMASDISILKTLFQWLSLVK